ncbi:transposase [Candidatus Xenohaliotis californiensis]|uniref:Transposase n=1 Tax=Candidatus Xenohaliotis californiensis TaxID=84677 RepID=A0ABM9N7D8_9RICK|nr:transposase [Candidatus Xenohaliotis californiensis]
MVELEMMDVVIKLGSNNRKRNKIYRIQLKTDDTTCVQLKKTVTHSYFVWQYFMCINNHKAEQEASVGNVKHCREMLYLLDLLDNFSALLDNLLHNKSAPKNLYEKFFTGFYQNFRNVLYSQSTLENGCCVELEKFLKRHIKSCEILKRYVNNSIASNWNEFMNGNEMCNWLTLLKQSDKYAFLNEVSCTALQQKLRDLALHVLPAKEKHKASILSGIEPNNSFRITFGYSRVRKNVILKGNGIRLPKIGWVDFYKKYKIDGNCKMVTVFCYQDAWYVCLQVELDV